MISPHDYNLAHQDFVATSVAFTGHRSYSDCSSEQLDATIQQFYDRGFRTFLSGMAVGFDMAAAESVVRFRAEHTDVELVCVVPFLGQQQRFRSADRQRYAQLLDQADQVVLISDNFDMGCYLRRNDFLVENASALIAWYDGSPGGTHYTFQRACKCALKIVNLNPQSQDSK